MAIRSNFSYAHTCPDIDKQIKAFQESLSDHLDEMIEELSPLFAGTEEKLKYRKGWEQYIYDSAQDCFEEVRKCNTNMRDEAEEQITNIAQELDEANAQISDMESRIEALEREVSYLQSESDNI